MLSGNGDHDEVSMRTCTPLCRKPYLMFAEAS